MMRAKKLVIKKSFMYNLLFKIFFYKKNDI